MRNVVNQAPFVEYPQLIEMLSSVEALFNDIENMPPATVEMGARVPVSPCCLSYHAPCGMLCLARP